VPHHVVIPEAFADFVLRRRWLVVFVVVVSTAACALVALFTPVRTSITQGFMPDDVAFEEYRQAAGELGGSSDDIIFLATAEGDALFTPRVLDAVRQTARAIERLPEVRQVDAFVDAPWLAPNRTLTPLEQAGLSGVRGMLESGDVPDLPETRAAPYWPESISEQQSVELAALRTALVDLDPLTGALISQDGKSQAMVVHLAKDAPKQWLAPARFDDRLKQIARQHGLGSGGVYSAGVLVTEAGMIREAARSVSQLVPIGVLVICILVYAVFRRSSLVILTLAIAIPAVAWSVGATALTFGRITLLIASAPLLITVISTSDTIHIASAYAAEIQSGLTREQAIRRTIADVGGACVLTSVTTFVGFMSLMVVPAAALRHFSMAISVGTAGALLLALTLCPIAFSIIDIRKQRAAPWGLAQINALILAFVERCKRLSLRHPRSVVALHAVVFGLSVYLTTTLTMDADLPLRFPKAHGVRSGVEFVNNEFGGANSVELYIRGSDGVLATPEFITALERARQRLLSEPNVSRAVSIATLLHVTDAALGFGEDEPRSATRLQGTLKLLKEAAPERLSGMLSPDGGLTRITLQTPLTRVFEIERLGNRAAVICREELPASVEVQATGAYSILGGAVQDILGAQYQGFTICFLTVMTIVGLGVRSVRLAALAVVPNLLPLALLGGLLWLTTEVVDPDILGVAIVSFGLAVDDTIHFLHRYDIERAKTNDVRVALEQTFDYTGLAIVRTTVILGLGLSALAFSGYLSVWFLGSYLVFVLGAAVFGDLLLLPALILLFDSRPGATTAS